MQAIGSRPWSTYRVDLPMPDHRRVPTCQVAPEAAPDGSPWVVVDNYTDNPAAARNGMIWVVDIDPTSRTYGDAVEVPADGNHPGVRNTRAFLRSQPHLNEGRIPPAGSD